MIDVYSPILIQLIYIYIYIYQGYREKVHVMKMSY